MYLRTTLSKNELFFLSDALSFNAQMPSERMAYPNLLLKIGSSIMMCREEGSQTADIDIDEQEAWLIREYAKTSIKFGAENIGLSLLYKMYEILIFLSNQGEISSLDIKSLDVDVNYREKIEEWKKMQKGVNKNE